MNEERQDYVIQEAAIPRWVGLVIAALAVVSLIALGVGWAASNRSSNAQQELARQTRQTRTAQDMLSQRLAKAEDVNAQLQGELSVVTDKMKLTEGELHRARTQATRIKQQEAKELTSLQNDLNGQLATKASSDDLNKLGTDVNGVKADLETTKNNLNMARGEFGTLIARNHDDIEELRRLGERDYYEFTINRKGRREKVGELMVELRGTNTKRNQFSVNIFVDDQRHEKKGLTINEPLYFFANGSRAPIEFVVNQVAKNKITGYISVPKAAPAAHPQATASGN